MEIVTYSVAGVPEALISELSETMELVRSGEMAEWVVMLDEFIPPDTPVELQEYQRLAIRGVAKAFRDRNLSPHLPQHTEIIPLLLDDIRKVFVQVQDTKAEYSREDFGLRAFDYGIHKAYYLDWTLYLSKEMY